MSFDLKFGDNVTITVSLKFPATGDRYIIKYVPVDNLFVFQRGNVVYIGYGIVHVEEIPFQQRKMTFIIKIHRKRFKKTRGIDLQESCRTI